MLFFKKKKKQSLVAQNNNSKKRAPYEERYASHLQALSCVFTIVNRHQEDFFIDKYNELGASLSVILYAYSKPPEELLSYLGDIKTKKVVIMTICRTEYVEKMMKEAQERFSVSKVSKGVAFSLPITNVAGIAVYKYFADINKDTRELKNSKKEK